MSVLTDCCVCGCENFVAVSVPVGQSSPHLITEINVCFSFVSSRQANGFFYPTISHVFMSGSRCSPLGSRPQRFRSTIPSSSETTMIWCVSAVACSLQHCFNLLVFFPFQPRFRKGGAFFSVSFTVLFTYYFALRARQDLGCIKTAKLKPSITRILVSDPPQGITFFKKKSNIAKFGKFWQRCSKITHGFL